MSASRDSKLTIDFFRSQDWWSSIKTSDVRGSPMSVRSYTIDRSSRYHGSIHSVVRIVGSSAVVADRLAAFIFSPHKAQNEFWSGKVVRNDFLVKLCAAGLVYARTVL